METILTQQMVDAVSNGDFSRFLGYAFIFGILWLEIRGLKTQLKNLNETISKSFAAGEKRFETIEQDVHQIRLDLDNLKTTRS